MVNLSNGLQRPNHHHYSPKPYNTNPNDLPDRFTDQRDGKVYKMVTIGTQTWMAENLAYKVSSNCRAYNNDNSYVSKYGYLYNWETAKNVCPTGWHLPSDEEWIKLTDYLGGIIVAGEKLKSTSGWSSSGNGNNASGFNALPGGYRGYSGGSFSNAGASGSWWGSTPSGSEGAWRRGLYYFNGKVERDDYDRTYGFSVRCLKDN